MAHYEIEVKSLLGEKKYADALKEKMKALDPSCVQISVNKQLNHYFKGGDVHVLYEKTKNFFDESVRKKFETIVEKGKSFSIRSRQKDNDVLLVLKASVDEGTNANSVSRLEFEEKVPCTLGELDDILMSAGFAYEAKWSREREEYAYKGANVCLDKNAGYGYVAEFEKLAQDEAELPDVRKELAMLMEELDVSELPQARLERMFAYYNEHWPEYYGTEKTFTLE